MGQYLLNFPQRQKDELLKLSRLSELTMAELLRRMIDHCMQDGVLCELVPVMSGHISVRAN